MTYEDFRFEPNDNDIIGLVEENQTLFLPMYLWATNELINKAEKYIKFCSNNMWINYSLEDVEEYNFNACLVIETKDDSLKDNLVFIKCDIETEHGIDTKYFTISKDEQKILYNKMKEHFEDYDYETDFETYVSELVKEYIEEKLYSINQLKERFELDDREEIGG